MSDAPMAKLRQDAPTPRSGGLVFWMLMLLALSAFTPCVLLPEWRQYQAICYEEQIQRHRADVLAEQVEEQRRLLTALRSDPAVVARLAQREYRFHRPGDQLVPVAVSGEIAVREEPFVPEPVPLPPPLARAASHLPAFDYDRVFCDCETRPIIMAMSVGLMALALCLFSRRGGDTQANPTEAARRAGQ